MTTRNRSRNANAERRKDPELRRIYERVGERIRYFRELAGLTQAEACMQAFGEPGMQSNWSQWERGVTLPNIATLHRIAEWAGTTIGDLGLYEPKPALTRAELMALRDTLAEAQKIADAALERDPDRAPKSRNGKRP